MLVKMEQVRKHYGAFELNCSLRLEAGRITGLIGPNGAGGQMYTDKLAHFF